MNILVVSISRKHSNKANFNQINAYHHAIYGTSLVDYRSPCFKKNQTKLINNNIYTVGIDHGVSVLEARLDAHMQLANGKRLYPTIIQKTFINGLTISDRPYLYKLQRWDALKTIDKPLYHQYLDDKTAYRYIEQRKRSWQSEDLRMFLENLLIRDIHHWLVGCDITLSEDFYVAIQPHIISEALDNHHAKRNKAKAVDVVFDVYFTSNLLIPAWLSIGNQTSIGYGLITQSPTRSY